MARPIVAENAPTVAVPRPKRWDHPLDPTLTNRDVQWLLLQTPFREIDDQTFPSSSRIKDILKNDSRILRYQQGDLILREGDYGGSAFLVLSGCVRVILSNLSPQGMDHQATTRKSSLLAKLRDSLKRWDIPEQIVPLQKFGTRDGRTAIRQVDQRPRIFLQDVDVVLRSCESEPLGPGEIFGELAAMTRAASHYSVVAVEETLVLEIRWQGLRMLRRDRGFRERLDARYRSNSLRTHLRESPLFQHAPDHAIQEIIAATELVSAGEMEWYASFDSARSMDVQRRIEKEPMIAEEGSPAGALYLIRAGFARLSHHQGSGHRTVSYLGKGQAFGLTELAHNYRLDTAEDPLPFQYSLRAIGFVDLLKIPKSIVYEYVLPYVRTSELTPLIRQPRITSDGKVTLINKRDDPDTSIETDLLEFLVDHRLINGRDTMVIDLERCTRCDDCIRACARTHQGNPRFVRQGVQHENWMFAHSCMHCADPVCLIGCPTGAIARDLETGAIAIQPQTCIGCGTCAKSCPYDNIVMVELHDSKGRQLVDAKSQLPILQATKCDGCRESPIGPACVAACPHQALYRIDMSELRTLQELMKRD